MKFSVILPSLLTDYPGAAPGRDKKLIRAIDSVLTQSFKDFELIVVADGCRLTESILNDVYTEMYEGKLVKAFVERKKLWTNTARNKGIELAKGDYIIYIDSDDFWGVSHLKIISDQLKGEDWIYYNDYVKTSVSANWSVRECNILKYGFCGTSMICHASRLNQKWKKAGYGHDFHFIQQLRKFNSFRQIETPEYYVCHIEDVSV